VVSLVGLGTGQLFRSDLIGLKTWRLSHHFVRVSSRYLLPLIGSTRPPMRSNRALPTEGGSTDGPSEAAIQASAASLLGSANAAALANRNRRRGGPRAGTGTTGPSAPVTGSGSAGRSQLVAGSDAGGPAPHSGTGSAGSSSSRPSETGTLAGSRTQDGQEQIHEQQQQTSVVREWVDELTGRTDRVGVSGIRIPAEDDVQALAAIFPDLGRETLVGALQSRSVPFAPSLKLPWLRPRRILKRRWPILTYANHFFFDGPISQQSNNRIMAFV
jgi:hypothetical protein